MIPQVGKAGGLGLGLKHKEKFTEIITDQYIQPVIDIDVIYWYVFPRAAVAHHGLVMALWKSVLLKHIPGIFACSLVCLHPSQANTDADEHSVWTFIADRWPW